MISYGGLAQLGERELCKLEVTGSIPVASTFWVYSGHMVYTLALIDKALFSRIEGGKNE